MLVDRVAQLHRVFDLLLDKLRALQIGLPAAYVEGSQNLKSGEVEVCAMYASWKGFSTF